MTSQAPGFFLALLDGCHLIEKFCTAKPEATQLKEIKKRVGA